MSCRVFRRAFSVLLLTSFFAGHNLSAQELLVPAFPGAEGFARYTTTGGRGCEVYHVTSLADSGPGTLRDAVSQSNRTIVFDVSGYIDLESQLAITKNNLTIAGQTAPGDGITVRYHTVFLNADNLIIRFVRFRRSQLKDVNDGADATWGRRHENIILDHCSFSWSIDEVASFYDNKNFTMQWCALGEALANPGHSKGAHSYGGIWGGKGASFHHNYLCHMQNRTPRFNGARYNFKGNLDAEKYENTLQAEQVDFRNCVMYNWGKGGSYGGPGGGYVNVINNYYKAGPGTVHKTQVTWVSKADKANAGKDPTYLGYCSRYYVSGNYVTATNKHHKCYDWKGVKYDDGVPEIDGVRYVLDDKHYYGKNQPYVHANGHDYLPVRLDEPIAFGEVTTHEASVAYKKVLKYAGASLSRDAVDARYMEECRTGKVNYTGIKAVTAGIVDSINFVGAEPSKTCPSFPDLKSESRPASFDTDGDGIPDVWEKANGLNPNKALDGSLKTLDKKGWYTNLEVYLNSLVEPIVKAQNSKAQVPVVEYYPKYKKN